MINLKNLEKECESTSEYKQFKAAGIEDFVEMMDLKWQGFGSLDAKNLSKAGFHGDYQSMKALASYLDRFKESAPGVPCEEGYKTKVVLELSKYGLKGDASGIINTIKTILAGRLFFWNIWGDVNQVVANIKSILNPKQWNPNALAEVVAYRFEIYEASKSQGNNPFKHEDHQEYAKAYQLLLEGKKKEFEATYNKNREISKHDRHCQN